jgi:hypothetical protein
MDDHSTISSRVMKCEYSALIPPFCYQQLKAELKTFLYPSYRFATRWVGTKTLSNGLPPFGAAPMQLGRYAVLHPRRFWARGNKSMHLNRHDSACGDRRRRGLLFLLSGEDGRYEGAYVVRTLQLVIGSRPPPACMYPPTQR